MDDDFDIPAAEGMMNNDMMDLPAESPILKVGEEKEIGKQGLKKKLLKEGEGWDTPDNGDEVEGQVIKGWGLGIKTMKKNENAIFTIPAELAYGESGSPLTIPPNYITTLATIPRNIEETHSSPFTPNIGSNSSTSTKQSREYHSGDKRSLLDFLNIFQERTIFLQEELSFKRQAHVEKMKVFQEIADAQSLMAKIVARSLDLKEKRLEMRMQQIEADKEMRMQQIEADKEMRMQQIEADKEMRMQQIEADKEMKIFDMDLSSITCDKQRETTRKMQHKILAKWNL